MTSLLSDHLLSCMIVLPFVGVAITALSRVGAARPIALVTTLLNLALAVLLWSRFDPTTPGSQFVERVQWMPTFNIEYAVGVDGLSVLMIVLTSLLCPLCVLCSWTSVESGVKAFMSIVLLIQGAMIVVFAALDLFLFFMLWEVTMIPMYFLITLWGGPGRNAAGLKFVLYSLTGSLCMLVGILGLYLAGDRTFDMATLAQQSYSTGLQTWVFVAFFLAFAIKLPMVPLHSWLPDAHSEAPTAGSVILAGIMLKMGGYGFLRLCIPMLPEACATFGPYIAWLSIVGILYGGFLALAQTDLKKLVAYSSISHMGFVTLGIFVLNSEGAQGAILQMFSHGVVTAALFMAVGVLYERTHSRSIGDYGGLHKSMPRFAVFLSLFAVAGFGLPTTANFIGEFLVLVGASQRSFVLVALALGGIVLGAGYMLWMLQRVTLGEARTKAAALLPDLTARETAMLVPLVVMTFWVGLYPRPFVDLAAHGVDSIAEARRDVAPRDPRADARVETGACESQRRSSDTGGGAVRPDAVHDLARSKVARGTVRRRCARRVRSAVPLVHARGRAEDESVEH